MSDTDITPLVTPDSPTLLEALAFPISEYGARFVDIAFWRPCIELIAHAHGIPAGEIGVGEPGSFPTFIIDRAHVVKLFSEHYGGLRSG